MATCNYCGKQFKPTANSAGKYCSRSCGGKATSGGNYNGGKETRDCEICGKEFQRYPSKMKDNRGRFCSVECRSENLGQVLSGPNSPCWSGGGISGFIRRTMTPRWEKARTKTLENAEYKCENCGVSEKETYALTVHHIIPVLAGGTNEKWNLICLCRSCHSKAEAVARSTTNKHIIQNR